MSIGEDKVISNFVKLDIYGNREGKIKAFNGEIVRNQVDYFMKITHSFDEALSQISPQIKQQKTATPILVDLGIKTGFFLLSSLMLSNAWKELVQPYIKTEDDWVVGSISGINSMGLGKWKIKEFEPNKILIVNIYDSYEADYYLENENGIQITHPICCVSTGIASSLMTLVYDVEIYKLSNYNDINLELFKKYFRTENSYKGKEVRCKAITKDYCEIIVERQS